MTNMAKPFSELVNLVHQWAEEKGIHEKSDGIHQLYKTEEEVEEFISHTPKQEEELSDDLGDIVVTLINYCYFKDMDIAEIYNEINQPIKHYRFTKQYLDTLLESSLKVLIYSQEYMDQKSIIHNNVANVLQAVLEGCHFIGRPVEECLGGAYEVISKRTGRMHNGQFVKDN
jgi:hypothetical protein